MVTSPHHLASQAGLDVLKDGGSAVEAAIATAAALAVVYPHMTGIGGDGFWLIAQPDGNVHTIDACGAAPRDFHPRIYAGLEHIPFRGALAANTVAGAVSGWEAALTTCRSGLTLSRLLRDAIHYAENGVVVTKGGAEIAVDKGPELRNLPGAYCEIFEPEGRPLREGDILCQPALARSLKRLAQAGCDDFYRGEMARRISSDLASLGSPVTRDDLAAHHASVAQPLTVRVSNADLFNVAPPTQGVASLLILALFDRLAVTEGESFAHVHGLVEATKRAFLLRDEHVGDPSYMTIDPRELLASCPTLDALAAEIDPVCALPWPHTSAAGDTVWFAAADAQGQVVSCIQSTYFEFGSGIVLPETGIIWQNRGASFTLQPDGWNALKPGRKPFHTLNPALARFHDGRIMAYGSMGGEGQPQTQAALFSRYAWFGVPLQEAVTRPRWLLGRTWGDETTSLKLEDRFAPTLLEALRSAGHDVEMAPAFSSMMGHAGAVVRHTSGLIEGAADPRSDGCVAAW